MMNGRQWRKFFAGGGVIAMLLGVLMVVMPTMAGAAQEPEFIAENPGCADIGGSYDLEAKDDGGLDARGGNGAATATDDLGNELRVTYWVNTDGTVEFEVDSTSEYLVSAVIIKQGNHLDNNSAAVYRYDPPVAGGSGLKIYPEGDVLSHITFCGATGSLNIDKIVTGDDKPADAATQFEFELTCVNNDNDIVLAPEDAEFTLTDVEEAKVVSGIPAGSECTLSETPVEGAVTTITVDGVETDGIGIVIGTGTSLDIDVTNDFPGEEPGSITLTKDLAGTGQPVGTTEFTVTVACAVGEDAVDLGDDAEVEISESGAPVVIGGLPAGAECTIAEVLPSGEDAGAVNYVDTSVECSDESEGDEAVDVTVIEDGDVSCEFTNTYLQPGGGSTPTFSIDIDKTNNADQDTTFSNAEFANGDDQDVTFQIVISNTGTGNVTVNSLVDTFSGESVNLLEDDVALVCDNGFPTSLVIEVGEDVTCTFVIEGYSDAGTSIVNTLTVDTNETGPDSDTSQVITPEVAQEATGSITVVKEMNGDDLDEWEAEIEADGTDVDGVTLTEDDDTKSWFGLGAGSYTLAENVTALEEGVAFESLACEDSDGDDVGTVTGASVSIDLAAGEDVLCTFVNTYTEPEVDAVVQPQAPAVLGDVVTRPQALPRTGSEASGLAAAGAGLLAMGMAMVLSSRMRYRRVGS